MENHCDSDRVYHGVVHPQFISQSFGVMRFTHKREVPSVFFKSSTGDAHGLFSPPRFHDSQNLICLLVGTRHFLVDLISCSVLLIGDFEHARMQLDFLAGLNRMFR